MAPGPRAGPSTTRATASARDNRPPNPMIRGQRPPSPPSSRSSSNLSSDESVSSRDETSTLKNIDSIRIPRPVQSSSNNKVRLRSANGLSRVTVQQGPHGKELYICLPSNDDNPGKWRIIHRSRDHCSTENASSNRSIDITSVNGERRAGYDTVVHTVRNLECASNGLSGITERVDSAEQGQQEAERQTAEKEKENKGLRAELATSKRKNEELWKMLNKTKEENIRLDERVALLTNQRKEGDQIINRKSVELFDTEKKCASLDEDLKKANKRVQELENNIASSKEKSAEQIRESNDEREYYLSTIENRDHEISRLESECQPLSENNETLTTQNISLKWFTFLLYVLFHTTQQALIAEKAETHQLRCENDIRGTLLAEEADRRIELATANEYLEAENLTLQGKIKDCHERFTTLQALIDSKEKSSGAETPPSNPEGAPEGTSKTGRRYLGCLRKEKILVHCMVTENDVKETPMCPVQ